MEDIYRRLPLPCEESATLVSKAKDWAAAHGLCMRTNADLDKSDVVQIAPFSLLPSMFPKSGFEHAYGVQQDIAILYHKLSHDRRFLVDCHKDVIKSDDFTRRLVEIYEKVMDEGLAQSVSLNIQRSDYMAHQKDGEEIAIKQVEVNNIAASFSSLDCIVNKLHRYLLLEMGCTAEQINDHIRPNDGAQCIAESLVKAQYLFGQVKAIVLFMVEDESQNIFDQRDIEYRIRERSNRIIVKRLKFTEAHKRLKLDNDKNLILDDGTKVAVVYWRVGYIPQQYPTENEWSARLLIERSTAIKAPWIGFHLAGTKKVQQILTRPGIVERYLTDASSVERIRSTFMRMYGLEDDEEGTAGLKAALKCPHDFVLKPQLEGGGNNIYSTEVADVLKKLSGSERAAYILMERIRPVPHGAYMIRAVPPACCGDFDGCCTAKDGQVKLVDCIDELGIYGYLIGNAKGEITKNITGGYLLRTKCCFDNEGGIMAGVSVLNTPFLV